MPSLLSGLYRIVDRLQDLFLGRKFTPDGHLVGSIGEAVAARMLISPSLGRRAKAHDATTAAGRARVQIKLTQGTRGVGLRAEPQHLLVLRLAADRSLEVVYKGGGRAPWSAGKEQKDGHRSIPLRQDAVVHCCRAAPTRLGLGGHREKAPGSTGRT